MRFTNRICRMILPLALLVLSGCFSLGRNTPLLEQYVLGGSRITAASASAPSATGLTIGLRRLDLASYLATLSIVTRRGDHQLIVSEFHRWGEDPAEGITRAVAAYLTAAAPIRAVDMAPWPVRSHHDYLVQLHVAGFEGVAPADTLATDGAVRVVASWELIRPGDGVVLARGSTNQEEGGWRVGDYAGLVTRLDGGLHNLAQDIVACLGRIGPATPPMVGTAERVQAVTCAPTDR